MTSNRGGHGALTQPPDGVLAGETVPRENGQGIEQQKIEAVIAALKTKGEPYTTMRRYELEEKARKVVRAAEGGEQ
jgi:hypothetical protein